MGPSHFGFSLALYKTLSSRWRRASFMNFLARSFDFAHRETPAFPAFLPEKEGLRASSPCLFLASDFSFSSLFARGTCVFFSLM